MLTINGNTLTIPEVVAVARNGDKVELTSLAKENIQRSRAWVLEIIDAGEPVYGINTGFGIFADRRISSQDSAKLSRNLILSHAVGTGSHLPEEVVRAAMLIRTNTLAIGNSGVRLEIVETLLKMLNCGVTPIIPAQGSLGSSGDLAQLSHLALTFTTDKNDREEESGQARYKGKLMSGKAAMEAAGLPRVVLQAKEGLAINNGATFSAAIAALAVYDAENLLSVSEISLSMSLEALRGVRKAFDYRIHTARRHPGQIAVAENVRRLTQGSTLLDTTDRVQDAYSLRCGPQIHGPAKETLDFVQTIIEREINAVTDNPLLFGPNMAISGGNFHGEIIGMGMDYLSIALTEIGGVSERRTFRMTDANLNQELPPMLTDTPQAAGLNSGMMMPQYTAASLVLENKALASPDSIHSLPTSAEQEDHNANAMTAARHTRQVIQNTTHILAIELYTATRALDLRLRDHAQKQMGVGTAAAHGRIREKVPYQAGDALWGPEIDRVRALISSGKLVKHVEEVLARQTDD